MFRSFGRNIRLVLVLFITVYIVASSFILYRTMEHRSLDMLRQLSVQYTGQQHKNTLLFMNWLEETSKLISNNQVVQNALKKPTYDGAISPILEGIRSSSSDILGIYIWGEAGGTYSSSNVSGLLPFAEIKKEPGMEQFLNNREQALRWTVLNREHLMNAPSDLRDRLLLEVKIKGSMGDVLGLLSLEVEIDKLYSFYLSGENTIYGGNEVYLLTGNGKLLSAADVPKERLQEIKAALVTSEKATLAELVTQGIDQNSTGRGDADLLERETADGLILLYPLPESAERIVTYISADGMNAELRTFKYLMLALNLVVFIVFWLLISVLSGSIVNPLKQLYLKINSTMKD
ncbi:cache domain-containing protein [Paenibacillus sp. FSL H7-0323]|uniref:cache domain-containing protein n=1 Tax=Paenibacillus sp. FSL H7-0323 TaxID=2921433 RepID=UPI0030FBA7DD